MAEKTKIEWSESTWNPFYGCKKVSLGCEYCYMYRDLDKKATRDSNGKVIKYHIGSPKVVTKSKTKFKAPLKWKEPRLIFTCSWSDWFIEEADQWRDELWKVIKDTPHHTYQILTKRPERIVDHLPDDWGDGYENVWIGFSAEDQKSYDKRIKHFVNFPAKVKFISCEPLLGNIDLGNTHVHVIDWVIVGGESGNEPNPESRIPIYTYRECKVEWIENIVSQSKALEIPVFVKQLGTHLYHELNMSDRGRKGGKIEEFPEGIAIRQFPYNYKQEEVTI